MKKVKFWHTRRFVAAVFVCVGIALGNPVVGTAGTGIYCSIAKCE